MEAVKPICKKYRTTLVLSDLLKNVGDRYYIQATAILQDIDEDGMCVMNTAYAREEEEKKGMDR